MVGSSWEAFGALLTCLGALLGHFWPLLGHSWGLLGRFWGALGHILGRLGGILEKYRKNVEGAKLVGPDLGPQKETLGSSKMSVSSRRNANFRKMKSVEKNVRSRAKGARWLPGLWGRRG